MIRDATEREDIHLLAYFDSDIWGGAEEALKNLLTALETNVKVTIVGTDSTLVLRLAHGGSFRVLRSGSGPFLRMVRFLQLWVHVLRSRPDVIQINLTHPLACAEAQFFAASLYGKRSIVYDHMPVDVSSKLKRKMKQFFLRRIGCTVVVSEHAAQAQVAYFGEASPNLRIFPLSIGKSMVSPTPRLYEEPTIIAMGRFTPQKGFDVLISCLPALPTVRLLLIGARSPAEREQASNVARAHGVDERVDVLDWESDACRWFGAADLLVVSSRWEGGPTVLLEALQASLPVVATDVGMCREVLGKLMDGLVVPVDDTAALTASISRVLGNEGIAREIGTRGRNYVLSRHSISRTADEFMGLYTSIMRGSR